MRVTPLTAALLATLAPAAFARTILVPAEHPTIQEAVDGARSGDVIKVAAGVYSPFAIVGKSNLTIKGKGEPIVDGGGAAAVVVTIENAERVTLRGLVIRNGSSGSSRGIDIDASRAVTIRRCRVADIYDALRAHASGGVIVQKNEFESVRNDGVDFSDDDPTGPAHDSQVRKNRFRSIGADAIEIEGENNLVEKNVVENADGSGITLEDSAVDTTVRKNRIANTGGDGIMVTGTRQLLLKNTVSAPGDDGIAMDASASTLRGNRVEGAADNGIEVGASAATATGNVFKANRVERATRNGFVVADGGNTFTRNVTVESGVLGLVDTAGAGANVYQKNRFDGEEIQ
jgi:parallel beta-helix repeat protein